VSRALLTGSLTKTIVTASTAVLVRCDDMGRCCRAAVTGSSWVVLCMSSRVFGGWRADAGVAHGSVGVEHPGLVVGEDLAGDSGEAGEFVACESGEEVVIEPGEVGGLGVAQFSTPRSVIVTSTPRESSLAPERCRKPSVSSS
jgi:hypothetical protein